MALDVVLSAAADGTRRAMLQRLAHGPATVGQLAALFPISRPAVSQHLRVLREAGLVRTVGTSRTSPYELVPGPLFLVETWARDVADRWSAAPTARPPTAAMPIHPRPIHPMPTEPMPTQEKR